MKVKVNLTREDYNYLVNTLLQNHKEIFMQLIFIENNGHSIEVELDEEVARSIRKLTGIEVRRLYYDKNKSTVEDAVLKHLMDKLWKMKIKVNLTRDEHNYLLNNLLNDHKEILSKLVFFEDSDNSISVELEAGIADDIRELASEEVGLHFDENYEPTEEGWILEHFIDKFYVE